MNLKTLRATFSEIS